MASSNINFYDINNNSNGAVANMSKADGDSTKNIKVLPCRHEFESDYLKKYFSNGQAMCPKYPECQLYISQNIRDEIINPTKVEQKDYKQQIEQQPITYQPKPQLRKVSKMTGDLTQTDNKIELKANDEVVEEKPSTLNKFIGKLNCMKQTTIEDNSENNNSEILRIENIEVSTAATEETITIDTDNKVVDKKINENKTLKNNENILKANKPVEISTFELESKTVDEKIKENESSEKDANILETKQAVKISTSDVESKTLNVCINDNEKIKQDEKILEAKKPVDILDCLTPSIVEYNDVYKLSIKVPEVTQRRSLSVACVIDISGSMNEVVGQAEGDGKKAFTRLDLVKHVLNVIINLMEETDELALILFTTNARLALGLVNMTTDRKKEAKDIVDKMVPESATYTFKGLEMAYNEMNKAQNNNTKSIILLTDGDDTDGETKLLEQFNSLKLQDDIQLNTFGFSNSINSSTLEKLASRGNGIFGFIPDQTMIGTIFINCIANLFLTYVQNISLKFDDKFELISPDVSTDKVTFYYGQTKNFLFQRKSKKNAKKLKNQLFELEISNKGKKSLEIKKTVETDKDMRYQLARKKLLEFLKNQNLPVVSLNDYVKSKEIKNVPEFLSEFQQIDEYSPNNEQLALALQNFKKWGHHYIRSMYFAHQYEQCLNYKSPSMQLYTNKQYQDLVEKLTDIFITLPLPEPSGIYYETDNSLPQINTRNMMNVYGGCILGTCNIRMENGEYIPIHNLKKNDAVFGGAKVVCLIKMKHNSALVRMGKLVITPFHPVFVENKWQFPYDIVTNTEKNLSSLANGLLIESPEDTYVYNIVLNKDHKVNVEGIDCITLGHMYTDGILKHDYYGTNKVIDDLSKLNGWNEGFISLSSYKIQRDSNGNVCSITDFIY